MDIKATVCMVLAILVTQEKMTIAEANESLLIINTVFDGQMIPSDVGYIVHQMNQLKKMEVVENGS